MPGWSKLAGVWLLAATVAVALSWGAVAKVRTDVLRAPLNIPSTYGEVAVAAEPPSGEAGGVTVVRVDPEVIETDTTSTTVDGTDGGGSPTTSTPPAGGSTTTSTTTSPSQSTTTTSVIPVETETSIHQLVGGVVTISYSPGVVVFVSAVPQPGYSAEASETGPEKVRVRFKSETHTSDFRAEWKNGELTITKKESGEDD